MNFRLQFKTTLIITHRDEQLTIPQGKGITFKVQEGIDLDHFQILEEYVNSKDLDFQDRLFAEYKRSVSIIRNSKNRNINDIDHTILFNILDLFDMDDFLAFIFTLGLVPPDIFTEVFEARQGKDEIRTYTVSQYFEFIVLIHVMNSVSPIMSMLVLFHDVSKKMAIVIPFEMLLQHPVMKSRAGVKFMAHVEAIFMKAQYEMVIIARHMSEREYIHLMACTSMLGKCAIHNIFEDGKKNLVTRIHQTLSGKTTTSGYYERSLSTGPNNSEDKLSTFDGVRRYYSVTGGVMEEFTFITEDPYVFANQFGKLNGQGSKRNRMLLNLGLNAVSGNNISDGVIGLVASVTKNYINPAAIEILGERSVRSSKGPSPIEVVLATGFMLTFDEFPTIAKLLVSHKLAEEEAINLRNNLNGRTKMKASMIEEAFPASKVVSGTNYIVEALNAIDDHISKDRLFLDIEEIDGIKFDAEIIVSLDFKLEMLNYFKWCNNRIDEKQYEGAYDEVKEIKVVDDLNPISKSSQPIMV